MTLWCTRTSVRRKPAGGSEQRWRKTQIVARTSGHPSRCRWTAGERASSRDARDILVSERVQSAFQCVGRRVVWKKSNAANLGICRLGTADCSRRSIRPRTLNRTNRRALCGRRKWLEWEEQDGTGGQSETGTRGVWKQSCAQTTDW